MQAAARHLAQRRFGIRDGVVARPLGGAGNTRRFRLKACETGRLQFPPKAGDAIRHFQQGVSPACLTADGCDDENS
jgi:hypothetical protein